MTKKKEQAKPPSFWYKLFRFFVPKDWKGELTKGKIIGAQMVKDKAQRRRK